MPGYLLDQTSIVLCIHAGQARPIMTCPRVEVVGNPVVIQSCVYTISGCLHPSPTAGNGPCVTAQFTSAATRVKVGGQPILLKDSMATCTPTGTGVNIVMTQTRVKGT
jgi:hypothetical protein